MALILWDTVLRFNVVVINGVYDRPEVVFILKLSLDPGNILLFRPGYNESSRVGLRKLVCWFLVWRFV